MVNVSMLNSGNKTFAMFDPLKGAELFAIEEFAVPSEVTRVDVTDGIPLTCFGKSNQTSLFV